MMSDPCAQCVSEIVKDCVIEAIHQAPYAFRLRKYVDDLVQKKRELRAQRESVHYSAMIAKQNDKKINDLVTHWLETVEILIAEAESLEDTAKTNQSCCLGHCPNWIWRWRLAKQIEKKAKEMVDQVSKCKFESFAHRAPPLGFKNYPSEGFFLFHGTKLAYDQLLQALKDDKVSVIGLHGMGGCGKTTLAKQIGKKATELFDRVVFVVVSNSVNIQKIQDSIAAQLDFKLKGTGELQKAQGLRSRLTKEEKIFIILDDVWEMPKFEDIGIPFSSNSERCKVLLTTRREQVCTLMDCQRTIPLQLLREDEASELFRYYARINHLTSGNLADLAQKIVHKCKGLAVAIAAIASTLKGKNRYVWEEAWETWRDSGWIDIEEGLQHPYKCLKLSYEYLKDEEAKSLFLLCSVFPEDFEIHEEDLARYGIGLGLFGKLDSFRRARNHSSIAKDKLIDSCLLMKTDNAQCVKMHDLARDVALSIAREGNWRIAVLKKGQEILKEDGSMKENTIRYLWLDEVDSFPSEVHFPKLEFLSVCFDKTIQEESFLPYECFKGMSMLRVLVIQFKRCEERQIASLSVSFQLLTNLHFLRLEGWKLDDISFVGNLERLQSLTLRYCSFNKLPNEIIKLKSLRLLDVRYCRIEKNPYEVIGRCSQLEELYFIGNSGSQWKDEHAADNFGIKGDSLVLQRYCMEIGRSFVHGDDFWTLGRGISVERFDDSTTNATIKDLVRRAEILYLIQPQGTYKNVIPEMIKRIGGMQELTKLVLDKSEDFEFFVDARNHGSDQFENVFPKLIELRMKNMKSLKTFYGGTPPKAHQMPNICNLKVLQLFKCPSLTHVFTFAFAESLLMLEELRVDGCDGLKHILTDERQHNEQRSDGVFKKLKRLSVSNCKKLEYLTTTLYAQDLTKLEKLEIENAPILEYVFAQSNQERQNHNKFCPIKLPCLEYLSLSQLPKLTSIFSKSCYLTCSSLKTLSLEECLDLNIKSLIDVIVGHATSKKLGQLAARGTQSVQYIWLRDCRHIECDFQLTGPPLNTKSNPLVSSLEYLNIDRLPKLSDIWNCPTRLLRLQNLKDVNINECNELKYIFSLRIVESVSQLCNLRIAKCEKLEQIIKGEESFDGLKKTPSSDARLLYGSHNRGSFNLNSLQLLMVTDCPKLTSLFTLSMAKTLTSLVHLTIERCVELQYVVKDERIEGNKSKEIVNDDGKAMLPNLKGLFLIDLPSLIEVYGGFNLQSVEDHEVRNCQKLTKKLASPSKKSPQVEGTETGSKDEEEEYKKDSDDMAVEENKWELCFSRQRISTFNREAGPSGIR